MTKRPWGYLIAGGCAGLVNGLFGAGGGMILIPLLTRLTDLEESKLFSSSIAIIAPICIVSLAILSQTAPLPWAEAMPYLAGSVAGGFLAAKLGRRIPVKWLHRVLGVLILWGGIRYLC